MGDDEMEALAGIRERLRALEARFDRQEADSRERHKDIETDLRELAKTVASLSQTVATLVVRFPSMSAGSAGTPLATGAGLGTAIGAIVTYLVTQYLPR
jgi:hypothetical protein